MLPPKGILMNAAFKGVTVPSRNTAIAVGAIGTPYPILQLIEEADGKSWHRPTSPTIAGSNTTNDQLNGAASTNNHVWAVGFYNDGLALRNLVMTKPGNVWLIIPCPNEDGTVLGGVIDELNNILTSVSAVKDNDIWAVGFYNSDDTANHPSTFHWNGAIWKSVPVDAPINTVGDINSLLNSISMVGHDDGWAVGYSWDYSLDPVTGASVGYRKELYEHWDGTKWKIFPISDSQKISRQLNGVSAISKHDAWAVGGTYDSANRINALIQHWDGRHWKVDEFNARDFMLNGVYAVSSNDVWVVGTGVAGNAGGLTLHWDGVKWMQISNEYIKIPYCSLNAVSGSSADNIWAVGVWGNNTIAQHWDGTKWKAYHTK